MQTEVGRQFGQDMVVSAAVSGHEAMLTPPRLRQMLVVSCVLSFVSAATLQQHAPAGIVAKLAFALFH